MITEQKRKKNITWIFKIIPLVYMNLAPILKFSSPSWVRALSLFPIKIKKKNTYRVHCNVKYTLILESCVLRLSQKVSRTLLSRISEYHHAQGTGMRVQYTCSFYPPPPRSIHTHYIMQTDGNMYLHIENK
jgi:hypothetical protein